MDDDLLYIYITKGIKLITVALFSLLIDLYILIRIWPRLYPELPPADEFEAEIRALNLDIKQNPDKYIQEHLEKQNVRD